jgi:GntR family transcriptional regulator, transcriptional repressor for pyruvate dehydrogenase complex
MPAYNVPVSMLAFSGSGAFPVSGSGRRAGGVTQAGSTPEVSPSTPGPFPRVEREEVLSNRVARMLLERVLLGELPPGAELPSERELSEQFGVSRTVVREAIRSLSGKGVIDKRNGRKARIGRVSHSQAVESMQLFIRGRQQVPGGLPYAKVHEVRRMLEMTVVELAATRATPEDVRRLGKMYEQMRVAGDDLARLPQLDVEFHRAIAEMSGNELFVIMLDSIGGVLTEIREQTLGIPGRPASALAYHQAILAAIEQGDPEAARSAMEDHLNESARVWAGRDS